MIFDALFNGGDVPPFFLLGPFKFRHSAISTAPAQSFSDFCTDYFSVPPHSVQIGQYVSASGEVVSHLNISAIQTNDGGLYACVAASTVGSVRHSARLNVYGLPYIR